MSHHHHSPHHHQLRTTIAEFPLHTRPYITPQPFKDISKCLERFLTFLSSLSSCERAPGSKNSRSFRAAPLRDIQCNLTSSLLSPLKIWLMQLPLRSNYGLLFRFQFTLSGALSLFFFSLVLKQWCFFFGLKMTIYTFGEYYGYFSSSSLVRIYIILSD